MPAATSSSAMSALVTVASTTSLGDGSSLRCCSVRYRSVARNAATTGAASGRLCRPATVSPTGVSGDG